MPTINKSVNHKTQVDSFKFYRDGVAEKVEREAWRWLVVYHDGTTLSQFDIATGLFHQLKEIDQSKLKIFSMVHDELPPQVLLFEPGMKLIHLYRRLRLNDNQVKQTWYIFGYERGKEKRFTVITPNEIVNTSDYNNVRVA